MDPEATLDRIVGQLAIVARTDKATADDLAESIHALAAWLGKGGYSPRIARLLEFADSLWEDAQ